MAPRTIQLVLHYDGAGFSGWQRQPASRTVQGEIEQALRRLCGEAVAVLGAGRTDAGVHARGQSAGVRVAERWHPAELRRALNALLPHDVWVAAAHEMRSEFHARYSATSRRYTYYIGTDEGADSPFRRRHEWALGRRPDRAALERAAAEVLGEHQFFGFAVRGTAPEGDQHLCNVTVARWIERPGGLAFEIEANRFLHHMVRFLVGTMLGIATGRRTADTMTKLLAAVDNSDASPPAPAHGLFLDLVTYPRDLYLYLDLDPHEDLSRVGPPA